jgi:hypothetical protein
MSWDRNTELNKLRDSNLTAENIIIRKMWIYHYDFEVQGKVYADAKTYYERTKATLMISLMAADVEGKKLSAAAAEQHAEADPDVWRAALAYRTAEQMSTADREALKILHGQLEAWRTRKADERAADQFQARTAT